MSGMTDMAGKSIQSGVTDLIGKGVLFGCCLAAYLVMPVSGAVVVPVLLAVITSGLLSLFDKSAIKTGLALGYALLACFLPDLAFFLPLIVFDLGFHPYRMVNLLAGIPLILFFTSATLQASVMVGILVLLAILIRLQFETHAMLKKRYHLLADTTKEMSGILRKQNQDLLEKQDSEWNLATLNERNRIAREIHDNVGHLLSSALLQSGALLATLRDDTVKAPLETLSGTLTQAMNSIRNSVHDLHDESVDLSAQLEALLKEFRFCEMRFEYQVAHDPDIKLKYALIAICREALANIMKHSDATQGSVVMREHPAFYQFVIRDNGGGKDNRVDIGVGKEIQAGRGIESEIQTGRDIRQEIQAGRGIGLINMADRVRSFNGHINIDTKDGFGIFIAIPKEDN